MASDERGIQEQLINRLADRLEAALEIVASAEMTSRLTEIADLCDAAAALARAAIPRLST